jgi:asparagine synthase (glutamine-hydrolysing)
MDYARAVGKHLGIRVREVAPTHKPLSWYRERAMRARTFPSYPNGVMGLGIREQAAARGSRALIVGIGGDEWLTGSRSYYSDAVAARDWSMLANCLLADRKHFGSTRALWWLLRIGFVPFLPGRIMQPLRGLRARRTERRAEAQSWLTPPMMRRLSERRERSRFSVGRGQATVSQHRQMRMLVNPFMAHARDLEEGMAAEAGIELRRPYYHRTLVEFAFAAPEWLRMRGRIDKYLHRLAMEGYLPEYVRTRETKAEFVITFLWHLPELEEELSGGASPAYVDWVETDRIAMMRAAIGDPSRADSPEWNLWSLIGCIALGRRR